MASAADPELVRMLLRFHDATGARRGEGLRARRSDIDVERQFVWLGERGGKAEEQPLPLSLVIDPCEFALARQAGPADDGLLRNQFGKGVFKKAHEQFWRTQAETPDLVATYWCNL